MLSATLMMPLMLAMAAPAQTGAMEPPAACAQEAAPPAELAGWETMAPAQAGTSAQSATMLPIGSSMLATLLPTPAIRYALSPEKPGASSSSGGMFAFEVAQRGRYRIALGSAAWVDVVDGAKVAVSVAHGHGPKCTGIRKMVDFDLGPGRYLLQVAGSGSANLAIIVARVGA